MTPQASDLALAHHLADVAARIALSLQRTAMGATDKSDGTPVSAADYAVEDALIPILRRERPKDGVLSEERGEIGTSHRRWIIDPIDMTFDYLRDGSAWGTHVALEVESKVELGVITRPAAHVRWWALRGAGAHVRRGMSSAAGTDRRIRVSGQRTLTSARVNGHVNPDSPPARALSRAACWTPEPLSLIGALADGRLDAVLDDGGQVWDHAPAAIIVEEAGGRFRDPEGGTRLDRGWGLYTNGLLDDALLVVLAGHVPG